MSHLLQLPTKILLQIYKNLSDIDDILRLGRSCRRTHAVLNPVAHRLSVFRSVIVRSLFSSRRYPNTDEALSAAPISTNMIYDSAGFGRPRIVLRLYSLGQASYLPQEIAFHIPQVARIPVLVPTR